MEELTTDVKKVLLVHFNVIPAKRHVDARLA